MIPNTKQQFIDTYGRIETKELAKGAVKIISHDKNFLIKSVTLPVVGLRYVHKACETDLVAIFSDIQLLVESRMVERPTWDGCWVPRHKSWNPKRGLSLHTWGIAVDLNAKENPMGKPGPMNRLIVQCFERRGWTWGGHWFGSSCDPMHFQRAATAVSF